MTEPMVVNGPNQLLKQIVMQYRKLSLQIPNCFSRFDRTERQGLKSNVRAVDHEMGALEGAKLHTDGYGYIGHGRIVVDEDCQVIVGATFIGSQVGELLILLL